MSSVAASNSKKSRPSASSFSSLPDDVALKCLLRVPRCRPGPGRHTQLKPILSGAFRRDGPALPRCYDLNLSLVSKALRSLVRSPELHRLRRSQLRSVFLSYYFYHGRLGRSSSYSWIAFCPGEKTTDYQLAQRSLSSADLVPSRCLGYAVSVGSEIYFIGGQSVPSTNLWIIDTRSGHLRTAPSMKVGRFSWYIGVGVIDGKIYVIGGSVEDSQVEVFDPETQTWDFADEQRVKCESHFSVSMKQNVYMVGRDGRVSTYSPREGINNDATEMPNDIMKSLCVVEDMLYACFQRSGLMWFNTKLKAWRGVVDRDGKDGKLELYSFAAAKMVEYEGMIAFFWPLPNIDPMKIMCKLIALDRVGEEILARIEWSGIVATLPDNILIKDCLVVSG